VLQFDNELEALIDAHLQAGKVCFTVQFNAVAPAPPPQEERTRAHSIKNRKFFIEFRAKDGIESIL
jgi:hypothetical protein